MNYCEYPYPSQRRVVFGSRGMVATGQSLAAEAGLSVLRAGGNAIDAAVATAAALSVVEPTGNGIGGDAFAILWYQGKLYGLNASGPAPRSISIPALRARGFDKMPSRGLAPITVPGIPSAWAALSKRFGRLPMTKTLAPAIDYAENGYAVSPTVSELWASGLSTFTPLRGAPEFEEWFSVFTNKQGGTPRPGALQKLPLHAETLRELAETNCESFYRGRLAQKIGAAIGGFGGWLSADDLAAFTPRWVDPISVHYKGHDIWEIPPNGQGIIALIALGILEGLDVPDASDPRGWHLPIEALKLAAADAHRYVTDPDYMELPPSALLAPDYLARRRAEIGEKARFPAAGRPLDGGTVYLAAADAEGNMISYIQSNFKGFGSGVVVPGTGIALQNRGWGFSLDEGSVNRLEGGKRTFHTIIPGFITKDGAPVGPFGVMGGAMQPQGHEQVMINLLDRALNPQSALDAPRWMWEEGQIVSVEESVPEAIRAELSARGHDIRVSPSRVPFGRGQFILRTPDGTLAGATEPRTDGAVAAM